MSISKVFPWEVAFSPSWHSPYLHLNINIIKLLKSNVGQTNNLLLKHIFSSQQWQRYKSVNREMFRTYSRYCKLSLGYQLPRNKLPESYIDWLTEYIDFHSELNKPACLSSSLMVFSSISSTTVFFYFYSDFSFMMMVMIFPDNREN